jgi:hypothetical protein
VHQDSAVDVVFAPGECQGFRVIGLGFRVKVRVYGLGVMV